MDNSPTVLEIDSKAIQHNLRYFNSKLNSKTKLLVVIKAFAYGSDSVSIARILEKEKVDYLAVAITPFSSSVSSFSTGCPFEISFV